MAPWQALKTVLFDLDGTLADTAPDLAYAINAVMAEQGREPLALEEVRPVVSLGGRALVSRAFHMDPDEIGFNDLFERFLAIYRDNVYRETRLFPGIPEVLDHIESQEMSWGIVTNKTSWLTDPLVARLGLNERAACVVSGDTTANRKPHPDPLLFACRQVSREPAECVYVGDAAKDIQAGHNAGMLTLVALFGYIPPDENPHGWGADGVIASPGELLAWLPPRGLGTGPASNIPVYPR